MIRSERRRRRRRASVAALVAVIAFAGCASDAPDAISRDDVDESTAPTTTENTEIDDAAAVLTTSETEEVADDDADLPTERAFPDRPLGDVCPDRIVVQLADLPSVEHGALVRLFARLPDFDPATAGFSAPIQRIDGTIEDVDLVLRTGGPAIGFRPATDALDDPSVVLAEATTADLVRSAGGADAVAALTDRSHAAIMWDPATHPAVGSIGDIGEAGIEVLHLTGDPLVRWLAANDVLTESQLIPGFDGEPAAFVASGGAIAQQSDVLIDPFLYEDLPQWGRPIAVAAATDEGWESYDDLLVVSAARRVDLEECIGTFVPLVQEAIAAQVVDPSPAVDSVLASMRADVNPFTLLDADGLAAARVAAVDSGVLTTGAAAGRPVASIDLERLARVVAELGDVLEVPPPSSRLGTNDLIDPSIAA
ncbi:MAG: hypothetical protein AAGD33_04170 [Actinomycetota bacterium]